jgi:hypothetical protein
MSLDGRQSWLLLLPQIPPHPSSLRVRVWRRLQLIGAVAVKGQTYALPASEDTLEDFTWLRQEIVDAGGGALLLRAESLLEGEAEIVQLFRAERDAEYRKIAEEAASLALVLENEKEPEELCGAERTLQQLRQRLQQSVALDFFAAGGRSAAESALTAAASRLERRGEEVRKEPVHGVTSAPRGRLWVTRAGVYVDRIASAWIISRFIDPEAGFGFVRPGEVLPERAIPFDMAGVEWGHHGANCTAETLVAHFRSDDPALAAVAQVVHDLDLKDAGFGRPEAPGLKRLLDGLCAATTDDQERLRRATPFFEALYAGFAAELGRPEN